MVCGNAQIKPGVLDTLLNPVEIFEVMSESTENIDKGYKFFQYQQIPSLQEYVVIDSRNVAVDVIRRQANDIWKLEKLSGAGGQLHLASINCTLDLDDLYYRVLLPLSAPEPPGGNIP